MKDNIPSDPASIGMFGMNVVMLESLDFPNFIDNLSFWFSYHFSYAIIVTNGDIDIGKFHQKIHPISTYQGIGT
ncbi:MAG: hypothetical protein U9P36_00625 [Thermodesulfobacteriota bacterium]|nr:hypothetical protein [Thermodesulfobacteriota bacterium]